MSNVIWKSFLAVPAAFSVALLSQGGVQASEVTSEESTPSLAQIEAYSNEGSNASLDQVTSVSQLTDVRPTDWAFQALQSLVERYGCIVGYPDRTYRGNQALTRYEFAAGLNACLDRISELIAANTADFVKKEDLDALRKLQEEFAAELATLRGRVDALEARTTTLEKQQFSTTTKLNGEVIFAIADTFGNSTVAAGDEDETNTIFADRVRLNFDSSFTGKDRLRVRLEAKNITNFSGGITGTNMTRLSFDDNNGNDFEIDELFYRFNVGSALRFQVDAANTEFYDALVDPVSVFASSGSGALSRYGRFNPFYRSAASGAGLTTEFKLSDAFKIQAGYIADDDSNDPDDKNGIFDGNYAAMAQVVFGSGNFKVAAGYKRQYYAGDDVNVTGSTGGLLANRPFGSNAASSDSVGASVNFRLGTIDLGGWFGADWVKDIASDDNATVLNGAVYAAFNDLGGKGNRLGLIAGVPPKVTDSDGADNDDTSIHLEALYRWRINDFISITPGVFVIINPEHNDDNDTQFVGTIRTTFTF